MNITGTALTLPDDIDTDTIIPTFALQLSRDSKTFADYAFYHTIPNFKEKPDKILAAGQNFGCGSSREEAVFALIHAGVKCILATSFAPIFKRNAFNNALLCIQMDTSLISDNDTLEIDIDEKTVYNKAQNQLDTFELTPAEETLLTEGGLLNLLKKRLKK
ncbi:MAG: 3-isopropylmalate dehydratase small subunit [Theionarchaea archaeon]|nr:3-isopropylmalate dehydratase small subunit [Theionarchaea archaeon]